MLCIKTDELIVRSDRYQGVVSGVLANSLRRYLRNCDANTEMSKVAGKFKLETKHSKVRYHVRSGRVWTGWKGPKCQC